MARNVTDLVQRFRLALRHLWNECVWIDENQRHWESVYSFRRLKLPLFQLLIAGPLAIPEPDALFGSPFYVVPAKWSSGFSTLQVNIRTPSSADAGVWMPVKGTYSAGDVSIVLIDLFDWVPLGYIDLRYYVGCIESFPNHQELVGHHVLVDVESAEVHWGEAEAQQPIDVDTSS